MPKQNHVRLTRALTIPAGQVFGPAPEKTEQSAGDVELILGLGADHCAYLRVDGDALEAFDEMFEPVTIDAAFGTELVDLAEPVPTTTELARLAYEAYAEAADWKAYNGTPIPAWDDLPAGSGEAPGTREKWQVAVQRVVAALAPTTPPINQTSLS